VLRRRRRRSPGGGASWFRCPGGQRLLNPDGFAGGRLTGARALGDLGDEQQTTPEVDLGGISGAYAPTKTYLAASILSIRTLKPPCVAPARRLAGAG
jgi:hypothetical protein